MNYWLLKSEPSVFSIDALAAAPRKTTHWEGVRNFQVRNMLRDDFKKGDLGFFYHSSCAEPGIAGIVEVVRTGYPDASAWDSRSEYYDAKSTENKPLWYCVDVKLVRRTKQIITLDMLRMHAETQLKSMLLLRRGNRLSVTPVDESHWKFVLSLE
ncbi:MAG: EVE domain-containing protein [Proteobacteria bacterium]|nr:EVE domain-containing protein [Pseudomonadota bacterium]